MTTDCIPDYKDCKVDVDGCETNVKGTDADNCGDCDVGESSEICLIAAVCADVNDGLHYDDICGSGRCSTGGIFHIAPLTDWQTVRQATATVMMKTAAKPTHRPAANIAAVVVRIAAAHPACIGKIVVLLGSAVWLALFLS